MKNERILILILIVLLAFLLLGGFGGMMSGGFMPHMDYGQWGAYWTQGFGWMGLFMWLTWILILVALVLGILWLVKQIQKK